MDLPKTISSCHDLLIKQQGVIEAQEATIAELMIRITKLEEQVNKNSNNSHKPPSSDGLQKKPAFPRKRGRKRGGKPGHKGRTLELTETPDIEIQLLPDKCSCGTILNKTTAVIGERRQVFDLPVPKLEITEYQKMICTCGHCGLETSGKFPETIPARVQYGSGVRSLTTLLNCGFSMPVKKIQQLFTDLFDYRINEGTIINNNTGCYELLEQSENKIKEQLLKSEVGHSDETGLRVAGKLHWLHVFCSNFFTFFFVHAKRGKQALEDSMSLLPHFSGWLVHDCWNSYFKFTGYKHALCGAHIIRELTALDEEGIKWAKWFMRYLFTLFDIVQANDGVLPTDLQPKALALFNRIAEMADEIEPRPEKVKGKRGKPKATKGRNLLNRLVKHQDAVLAFAFHQNVPFTNNLAERDLRPIKTKQKVSGSFRTFKGAQNHARICGFISTARKHKLNIFNELKNVFEGKSSFVFRGTK